MRRGVLAIGKAAPWLALAMLGCTAGSPGSDPSGDGVLSLDWTRSAALTAATDCEQAETWLEDAAIAQMRLAVEANRRCVLTPDQCGWYRGGGVDMGVEDGTNTPAPGGPKDDETPDDYSQTNTQVEGVDEADRVKTDGRYLYVLSNQDLVVVRSWPAAETAEVGRVRLAGWPAQFFLDGDRAIVLGSANLYEVVSGVPYTRREEGDTPKPEPAADSGSADGGAAVDEEAVGDSSLPPDGYYEYRPVVTVTVVSLADRTAPRVLRQYVFEGYMLDSRRIEARSYLALNNYPQIYDLEYWPQDLSWYGPSGQETRPSDEAINAAFDALIARNEERIRARTLDEWLPRVWTATGSDQPTYADGRRVGACTDVHAPSVFSGQGLLSLISLDVESGDVAASTIQGTWGTVYASLDAIYIGSTNWDFYWWWQGSEEVPPLKTHVHKFAFDRSGNARYRASGEVLGYAINQFAFDENEGYLRVATTDGFGWWNGNDQTESRVTVLRENGERLEPVGLVGGLGKGERIFAVRFLGDQGYVVTFRQVDPLYVLDLRDPAAPRVAGELKIPGFSSYIHPLEPGYLLTAGRDGDEEGRVGGVKIEIFDVTDPTNPKSVRTAVIGDGWNTWSDVLWDHKAFTFFRSRNLLAIPVSGWVESSTEGAWWGQYKSELALFRVTRDSIETLPTISHMGFFDDFGGNDHCRYYSGYWQAQIYRGVFVEDYVYSLSALGLQVHDTRDLAAGPVAEMTLLDPASFPVYDWDGCVSEEKPEDPTDPVEPPPDGGKEDPGRPE